MHDQLRDHVIKGKHGRYKLIDIRGSGSMATVYIGRDLNTNRLFAVKVLRSEVAEQQEMASRFEREATILTLLIDPHIVRQLEYGRDGTLHYVVMDYIDGVTLKELILADGPFSIQRALDTAHQIAEGLEAAHKKRIIHRDMKPQNILVSTTNVVKLTDFGMARTLESVTITQEGSFLGTPYYVAPEQAVDGHSADIRSDLYSLGCIFFEMLTGQVPYESNTALEVIIMHLRNPVPSACQLRPILPTTIDSFIQKAMAKDPYSRFQTPQDFIEALATLSKDPAISGPKQVSGKLARATLTLLATGHTIALSNQHTTIGRYDPQRPLPDVDLSALDTDRMVSRSQARILQRDGQFFVEDLKPRNPTRRNGISLNPVVEYELHDGDLLRIGSIEMRFNIIENP